MTSRQFIVTLENMSPQPHIERMQVVAANSGTELQEKLIERFQLPADIRIIFYTSPEGTIRTALSLNDVMVGTAGIAGIAGTDGTIAIAAELWIRVGIP